jgi:hypothetical protein
LLAKFFELSGLSTASSKNGHRFVHTDRLLKAVGL